jgi:hypothetical protein
MALHRRQPSICFLHRDRAVLQVGALCPPSSHLHDIVQLEDLCGCELCSAAGCGAVFVGLSPDDPVGCAHVLVFQWCRCISSTEGLLLSKPVPATANSAFFCNRYRIVDGGTKVWHGCTPCGVSALPRPGSSLGLLPEMRLRYGHCLSCRHVTPSSFDAGEGCGGGEAGIIPRVPGRRHRQVSPQHCAGAGVQCRHVQCGGRDAAAAVQLAVQSAPSITYRTDWSC